jgi:uncharacterized protein (TIGR02001 family)
MRCVVEFSRARRRIVAIAAAVALLLTPAIGDAPHAQTRDDGAAGSINLGARGGLAAETPVGTAPRQDGAPSLFELSARAGFASDYIYRGVTLSDRKPAVGAGLEAVLGLLYAGATATSVALPSRPAAEITTSAGVRPKLWDIDFDLGWTYFLYPGETVPVGVAAGIDYWEAAARADTRIGEMLRVAGGFAYSPNVSNTGAWSKYAALGLGLDLPRNALPQDVTASLTGSAGYYWFGNQSASLGGFPLPAYLNWNAGVTLTRKIFNLDLRYYDTNLSKEDCFVFTGDPNATPGGSIDPVRNPQGLTSRWCSHVRREVLVRIAIVGAVQAPRVIPSETKRVSSEPSQAERESLRDRRGVDHGLDLHAGCQRFERRWSGWSPGGAARGDRLQCRVGHHRCGVLHHDQRVRPQSAPAPRPRDRCEPG